MAATPFDNMKRQAAPLMSCGTQPHGEQQRNISKRFAAERAHLHPRGEIQPGSIKVNVFAHVVYSSKEGFASTGWVEDADVERQIEKLNTDFSETDFSYVLVNISRTQNERWSRFGDEFDMKAALRKGSYGDLNLYILAKSDLWRCKDPKTGTNSIAGSANYPHPEGLSPGSKYFIDDGCMVFANSIPGAKGDDEVWPGTIGFTATHEVGHWHDLVHTFGSPEDECRDPDELCPYPKEGCNVTKTGCSEPGDFVDDTPSQRGIIFECTPRANNSCGLSSPDPLDNFMGYAAFPPCKKYRFTPGQNLRMRKAWFTYRHGHQANVTNNSNQPPQTDEKPKVPCEKPKTSPAKPTKSTAPEGSTSSLAGAAGM
ncbi:putative RNA-binding protein [Purpureocillium lavendulum]|uniref:RNA-binding protein n=1 Tax=Purpureocillium lavendulum TaxID=1247861 RepID=A0AB34G453_9HYPO|nr:putative RNA-binding protein [Purpureocillium lavendulum]